MKINIFQTNIKINNTIINQGLDTSIITTNTSETKEINPDYKNIAKSSAITGAIAGGIVVAGEWLSTKPNSKPKLDRPTEGATYKPTQQLLDKHPDKLGHYAKTGTNGANQMNVGTANLTNDINMVNKPIYPNGGLDTAGNTLKPPSMGNEGSWFMKPISHIPGMNGMATSIHDPLSQIFFTSNAVPQIVNDILIVASILPSIPASYCIISPSACASIINNKPIKPSGNNLPNLPEKPKSIMFTKE